jgi:KamA family protein
VKKYLAVGIKDVDRLPQLSILNEQQLLEIKMVSEIYPFKTNNYVLDELINWQDGIRDPLFLLNFPQKEMLVSSDYERIVWAKQNLTGQEYEKVIVDIRSKLNPHPAGQIELNIPEFENARLNGIQHKYENTILFFPSQGQTCHAYCTFCFRWPQFVGDLSLRIRTKEIEPLISYLHSNKDISDIIFTGGDPMIMSASILDSYIAPLLEVDSIKSIRIGSKSLSYWPYRYIYDDDTDMLMEIFRKIVSSGRHLAFMAHFNHPAELRSNSFKTAVGKIRDTGAEIRTQTPLLKNINDDPLILKALWEEQVQLGCIPYYMFLARDTGAQHYFAVSLDRALNIYREAIFHTIGLCRTVRGPVMSTTNGKVEILDHDKTTDVYTMRFIQHRNPELCYRCFYGKPKMQDPIWFDQLTNVRPEDEPYFK